MSYNYTQYQTYLATMMATQTSDTYFQTILPEAIDYAEQRIYRELQLLNTNTSATVAATVATPSLTLPSTTIVVNRLNVITPAGSTTSNGLRNPIYPVSREYLNWVYPNDTVTGLPVLFAMDTQTVAHLGPSPDQAYNIEVVATQRPTPLSASNTTTILTNGLPDLFLAASMIFMAGYQKNFGAQSDDPKMAESWEDQYEKLRDSALTEEFMKKFAASSWTSSYKSTAADTQRG